MTFINDQFYAESDSVKVIESKKRVNKLITEATRLHSLGYSFDNCDNAISNKKFTSFDINIIKGILKDYRNENRRR